MAELKELKRNLIMEQIKELEVNGEKGKRQNKLLFFAGIAYFTMMVLFAVFSILASNGLLSKFSENASELFSSFYIQIFLMLIIPISTYCLVKKQSVKSTLKDFGLKKIKAKTVLICIVLGVIFYILNIYVANFFQSILGIFNLERTPTTDNFNYSVEYFLLTLFTTAILPAFCEEIAHRGMILHTFKKYSSVIAILISALCFGFAHMNIYQFFYCFLFGLVFGYVTIISGSIIPAMIFHFINNFSSLYIAFSLHYNWIGNDILIFVQLVYSLLLKVFGILCPVIVIMGLVYLAYILLKKVFIYENGEKALNQIRSENIDKYSKIIEQYPTYNPDIIFFQTRNIDKGIFEYYENKAFKENKSFLHFLEKYHFKLRPFYMVFFFGALTVSFACTIVSIISNLI